MKRINSILFTLIFVLLCSCSQQSDKYNVENKYKINLEKESTPSIYDLFSKVEIVPLETKDSALLDFPSGESEKVVVHNGTFWFLYKNKILVFDSYGMYLKQLNKQGRGPGEYYTIEDFCVSPSEELEILCSSGHYIMKYDANSLEMKKKIDLPREIPPVSHFEIINSESYILVSKANEYKMFCYNVQTNVITELDYSLPKWMNRNTTLVSSKNPFHRCGDSLCFTQSYNGHVWTISSDGKKLVPRYFWDFGDYNLTLKDIPQYNSVRDYIAKTQNMSYNHAMLFLTHQENEHYYFTRFKFKNRYKYLIIDKINRKHLLFDSFKEGGQCLPQAIDDKYVYSFLPAYIVHKIIDFQTIDEKSRQIIEKLDKESNPIIVKYHLK